MSQPSSPLRSRCQPTILHLILALVCAAGLQPQETLGQEPETRRLTILVTSGLSGQLAQDDQTIASVPALLQKLAAAARTKGHGVVVLDAGRTLVPYAESRHDRGRTMGQVLSAGGCQVFAPDPMDFSLGAEALSALAENAPFKILQPFRTKEFPLPGFVEKVDLEPLPGVRLEVVSLFDKQLVDDLRFAGIEAQNTTFKPTPKGSIRDTLRLAVIHSWNLDKTLTGHSPTWKLVESERTFDVLLDFDLGHDLTLKRQGKEGALFLVGRAFDPAATWTVVAIEMEVELRNDRWQPRSLHTVHYKPERELPVDPDLELSIRTAFSTFREDTANPIGLDGPVARDDLELFVLKAVREAAKAEVAIINQGALRPVDPKYFSEPQPREELVHRLLSIDQRIVVGYLTGQELTKLYQKSAGRVDRDGNPLRSSLRWLGMEEGKKKSALKPTYEINGRELYPKDRYRVVTNTFLSSGGDDYPILTKMKDPELLGAAPGKPALEIRQDVVLPRLKTLRSQPFADLERRGLWRFGFDHASISWSGVETSADEAYKSVNDSRARADASLSLQGDFYFRLDQEWPAFRWENRIDMTFGLVNSEDEDPSESNDDLELEVGAVFLKSPFGRARPYASLVIDTELLRNDGPDGQKLERQLEESLTVGLSWSAERWTLARFALVARRQDDVEQADRFGLLAEAEYRLEARKGRPAFVADVEGELLEGAGATVWSLDLEVKTPIKITNTLKLTPAYNLYLYSDSRLPGLAEYHRFSLGLSYRWIGKHQKW